MSKLTGPVQIGTPRDPSLAFYACTPSDTTPVAFVGRALYFGTSGSVSVSASSDSTNTPVSFSYVNAGQVIPVRCNYVFATGTTASGIVILR